MPELPEVETTRRGLAPVLEGQRITRVVVRDRRLRWRLPAGFEAALEGRRVQTVARRAKYLLIGTDGGTLIVHLGMSGSLRVVDPATPPKAHDHVDLVLSSRQCVRFNDPRRFGSMHVVAGDPLAHPLLRGLGPEPLSADFDADYLYRRTRRRRVAIKQLLMNAAIVVGVGNIYASEALFRAGVRPQRAGGRLTRAEAARLVGAVRRVLARRDQGRRHDAAGLRQRRRPARLLPAEAVRLRARRAAVPRVPHADPPARPGTALDLLVPYLPALNCARTAGWISSSTSIARRARG